MADTKISALPASTTPLAGTEVLPVVQGGTTKQVSVANLTAGRNTAVNTLAASAGVWIGTTSAVSTELANIVSTANSTTFHLIRNTNVGSSAYCQYTLNASGNSWGIRMGSGAANSNALDFAIDALGSPVTMMSLSTSGNLSVTGTTTAAKVQTAEGATGSIANGATTTLFALPSVGTYLVTARQDGAGNGGIRASAIVMQGSSSNGLSSLFAVGGATLVQGTGFNVDLTNTAGGAAAFRWSYIKLSS